MSVLHRLYRASGLLSAAAMVLICVLILAQITARNLGTTVRDADEFAAWAMAASGFLGLPYALYCGSHIRVSVGTRFLSPSVLYATEVLASAIAFALAAYLAFYCTAFVIESYRFNEVSQGLVPVPLWIPQSPMVLGSVLLALGFGERLVRIWRREPFEIGEGAEKSE